MVRCGVVTPGMSIFSSVHRQVKPRKYLGFNRLSSALSITEVVTECMGSSAAGTDVLVTVVAVRTLALDIRVTCFPGISLAWPFPLFAAGQSLGS